MPSKWKAGLLTAALIFSTMPNVFAAPDKDKKGKEDHGRIGANGINHVLLISIDGMHSVDFINCSQGVSGVNGGNPYCPNLAALAETGVTYRDTSTSKPSDSFPGLTAIVSGGGPRTEGAFYDVAYDRSLDGPALTTGNGVAGSPGLCTPNTPPTGYTTEFDEGIDLDKTQFNGGNGGDPIYGGGITSIDPMKLDRDPAQNCAPVFPWNFVRTNTIFGVIHSHGGYTAWTDKHPSYSSVSGHGTGGKAISDYFAPEINSIPVGLPGINAQGVDCTTLPDQTAVAPSNAWTDSFANIQCYDQVKVNSILHEISGLDHSGQFKKPRPNLLGMNFQVVSVGEKLIEKQLSLTGGYQDSIGTPTPSLLGEIEFADTAIGDMVAALKANDIYHSTLIIITAKHGQSPIDSARYLGIANSPNDPITTSPATILDNAGCIPSTESPSNPNGIGPTEDDVSLVWLNNATGCDTASAVAMLRMQSPTTNNIAGIGELFSGPNIETYFNLGGFPNGDPRTPDILTTPDIGVTYSGSTKKLAEHGGFSRDDTNVIMLVSNPSFQSNTVTGPVETMQVAPTILKALGLDPDELETVRTEGTAALPGLDFGDDNH